MWLNPTSATPMPLPLLRRASYVAAGSPTAYSQHTLHASAPFVALSPEMLGESVASITRLAN